MYPLLQRLALLNGALIMAFQVKALVPSWSLANVVVFVPMTVIGGLRLVLQSRPLTSYAKPIVCAIAGLAVLLVLKYSYKCVAKRRAATRDHGHRHAHAAEEHSGKAVL